MIKKIILLSTLTIFSAFAYAGEHGDMQVDCHSDQIHFAQGKVWLNEQLTKPQANMYIIHNIDKKNQFWLNHESLRPMHAGWNSQISPDNWSALKLSEPKFNLVCTDITSAGTRELDCSKLLTVCLVTNVKFPKKELVSSYWVSEDKHKDDFYHSIVVRNIIFKPAAE
jgi:hypothetical protein